MNDCEPLTFDGLMEMSVFTHGSSITHLFAVCRGSHLPSLALVAIVFSLLCALIDTSLLPPNGA